MGCSGVPVVLSVLPSLFVAAFGECYWDVKAEEEEGHEGICMLLQEISEDGKETRGEQGVDSPGLSSRTNWHLGVLCE